MNLGLCSMEWESLYCAVRGKSVLLKQSPCFTSLGEQRWFYRGEDGSHKIRANTSILLGISILRWGFRARTFCPCPPTCCGVNPAVHTDRFSCTFAVVTTAILRLFLLHFCGCSFCAFAVVSSALLRLFLLRFCGCFFCVFCGCSFCTLVVVPSAFSRLSLLQFCGCFFCSFAAVFVGLPSAFLLLFLLHFCGSFFCTSVIVYLLHFCGYSLCDSAVVSSALLRLFLLHF